MQCRSFSLERMLILVVWALSSHFTFAKQQTAFNNPPGVVIAHSPTSSGQYIGSPSIAILPDKTYVASHDFFGPAATHRIIKVYRSTDAGKTWKESARLEGGFWSNLFTHQGVLYLLGTNCANGALIIRRSTDGGYTWTSPHDAHTGLLRTDAAYHTSAVPIVEYNGRLWRGIEDEIPGQPWGKQFRSLVMSAQIDANLMEASSWTYTNPLPFNPSYLNGNFGGWLEGNIVVTPGGIINVLRVHVTKEPEKVALISINPNGTVAQFDPSTRFINFPGGAKKFTIRFDPGSGLYWALSNYIPDRFRGGNIERTRNTLALICSSNLRQWNVVRIILQHADVEHVGFQYADWQIDGEDIVFVSRTAFFDGKDNAHNQHDANFLTFHRIDNFRSLID